MLTLQKFTEFLLPKIHHFIDPVSGALALGGISAVGSWLGGKEAGDAAAQSSADNIAFQKWLWGEQQEQMQPFIQGGAAGMDAYMQALGFTKRQTSTGEQAGDRARAASGYGQTRDPLTLTGNGRRTTIRPSTLPPRETGIGSVPQTSQAPMRRSKLGFGGISVPRSAFVPAPEPARLSGAPIKNRLTSSEEEAWLSPIGMGGRQGSLDAYRTRTMRESGIPPGAVNQIMNTGGIGNYRQPEQIDAGPGYEWVGPEDPLADEGFNFREFSFGEEDLYQDPSYKFRFKQGQEALQSSALADAGLLRGSTAKALSTYGQEAASQEYGKAYGRAYEKYTGDRAHGFDVYREKFDRRQTMLNNLWQLAQGGMNAAVGAGSSSSVLGQQVGQSYSDLGNIGAASAAGKYGSIGQGIGLGLQAYDVFS